MTKAKHSQRRATKIMGYLDDGDDHNYTWEDDEHYADEYDDIDDSCEYNEYKPRRTPLTISLFSTLPLRPSTRKPKRPSAANDSVLNSEPSQKSESEMNTDPLAYVAAMKPRLVRSISFKVTQPVSSHRRTKSLTGLDGITPSATMDPPIAPPVQCIQSLIPARPSLVGPTPRASLTIKSAKCRAAVLLVWSFRDPEPRVLPLVGCNMSVTSGLQIELRARALVQGVGWQAYWNMCTSLYERREEWVALLEDHIPESQTQRFKYLSNGCRKATMTLGQCYNYYEMLQELETLGETPNGPILETRADNDRVCLVCFEEIETETSCQLQSCGHTMCMDCSMAYLKSAAFSGHGSIKCSAFKCESRLDMFDAAHILDLDSDQEIWERIVRFTLERVETPPGTRVCTARNCGLPVKPTLDGSSDHPGFNMLMCDCGTARCRDCNNEGHPGVTCSNYKGLRRSIDSKKLDAELANIQWVINHSRPCPKCQYPIEKDGGCNHVRCQQCEYYFCFQCGGEGHRCMAYVCKNTHKYWHENHDYDEGQHSTLVNLVDKYRAYRSTKDKLSTLINSLADFSECANDETEVLHEIQCRQTLLWLYVSAISRMMSNHEANPDINDKAILSLQLVLRALSLRKQEQQDTMQANQPTVTAQQICLPPAKRLSHAKQLAEERHPPPTLKRGSFEDITAYQELQGLLSMDAASFAKKVRNVIQQGVQALRPRSIKKRTNRQRRSKKFEMEGPLNQKMERPKDPWRRSGYRYCDEDASDEDWSDDGGGRKKRRNRWRKDKFRVKARRDVSLDLYGL